MRECERRGVGWVWGGVDTAFFPLEAIDFQASYGLFVCTDTLKCKLVKCEVHHLSPAGPRLIFLGLISAHIYTEGYLPVLQIRFRYCMRCCVL